MPPSGAKENSLITLKKITAVLNADTLFRTCQPDTVLFNHVSSHIN